MDIKPFLDTASSDHSYPARVNFASASDSGDAGSQSRPSSPPGKHLLVIAETDGCFVDGVIAVTKCTVGHRTLRIEDYGKIAATFVNVKTNQAIRISPTLDVREKANLYAPEEKRHYFAQMHAYQSMPDDELMTVQEVTLIFSVGELISHAGKRVNL